jgi:hypothetical protein
MASGSSPVAPAPKQTAVVTEPAPLRLYRATVSAHFMLDKSGEGPPYDHRTPLRLTRG